MQGLLALNALAVRDAIQILRVGRAPRLIAERYLGYAVIDWKEGWEALPDPGMIDMMWNGISMTEAELREMFGDLPPLPGPTEHPWHDNNRLKNFPPKPDVDDR